MTAQQADDYDEILEAEVERVGASAERNGYVLIAMDTHPGEYVLFDRADSTWTEHGSLAEAEEYLAEDGGNDEHDPFDSVPHIP